MQYGHPAPQQEDHKSIQRAMEESYILMVRASTALLSYLQNGNGPIALKFMPFYTSFAEFFALTSVYKDLDRYKDVIDRIDAWLDAKQPITRNRAEHGLKLMRDYQRAVSSELLPLRK